MSDDILYGPGPERPKPWLPLGAEPLAEGTKYDTGKVRWDLIPYESLEEVAKVYTFGATKYGPHNWRKGIAYSRCFAALLRHLFRWWIKGEKLDAESRCHPLAAVAFYCLNFMQYEIDQNTSWDDRGRKPHA